MTTTTQDITNDDYRRGYEAGEAKLSHMCQALGTLTKEIPADTYRAFADGVAHGRLLGIKELAEVTKTWLRAKCEAGDAEDRVIALVDEGKSIEKSTLYPGDVVDLERLEAGWHLEHRGVSPLGVHVARGSETNDEEGTRYHFTELKIGDVRLHLYDAPVDGYCQPVELLVDDISINLSPSRFAALRLLLRDAGVDRWLAEQEGHSDG